MGAFDGINPFGNGIPTTGQSSGAFGGKGSKNNINALFSNPVLMQAIFALSAAGKNPFEELGQFFSKDKPPKGSAPGSYLKVGNQFLNIGAVSQKLPDYTSMQQDAALKAQGATYDKLKNSPQFAGIFGEANGQYGDEFNKDLDAAYTQMAGSALGVGAKSGFLADPNKQAQLLGPLALNKVQYLKGVQKNAEAQALGYSGAGLLGGSNPAGLLGAGPAGSYYQPEFAAGNLFQGNNQFNAQLGFNEAAAKVQAQQQSWDTLTKGYGTLPK